jgi:DNA adenine methylase
LLILENELLGIRYVEPYAGGASVALSLLFEDYVSSVVINDLNRGVYALWLAVLTDTDRLCELVQTVPVTVDEWQRQREIAFSHNSSDLERGFATFFLNRTNRSGIVSGGVIGGLDQIGRWKIDARFPRDELIRRIRKVARFRSRITLTCEDTLALLGRARPDNSSLYFLDPPYYDRGHRLYDNFYSHGDHVTIRDAILKLNSVWVVSYDAAKPILQMYSDYQSLRYTLAYSANARLFGSEVMFFSPSLTPPEESPPSVSTERVDTARLGMVAT